MIKQLMERWHAPTPAVWKKVQKISGAVSMACGAMAASNALLPQWVATTGAIAAGLTAVITQFSKEDEAKNN